MLLQARRVIIYVLMLLSCRSTDDRETFAHPEYFDGIFQRAETMKQAGSGEVEIFLDSAYHAFPSPGVLDLYRKYMFISGYYMDNRGDLVAGLKYADSALLIIQRNNLETELAKECGQALFRRGYCLMVLRRYAESFDSYNAARQLTEAVGDSCTMSAYTFMLGMVCDMQHRNLEAARYTKKGVQELKSCPDSYDQFRQMSGKLDDIGIYYSRQNMPDSALYYFHASLDFMQQNQHKYKTIPNVEKYVDLLSGVVYGNMGTAYARKGDTATAEKLFLESLRINTKKGYHNGDALFTWVKLVNLYLIKGRLPEAGNLLNDMRSCLDTLPDLYNEVEWYRLKFDYLYKTGQQENISHYIRDYLKLADSLSEIATLPQVDVNKEYDYLKNQYELVILEKQGQVKNLYLVIVISFSLVAIFITLLLWRHWQRVKKLHKHASDQNSHLQKALSALEQSQEDNTRMMKIAAHDLRSPIGGITALASLMLEEPGHNKDDIVMLEMIKTSGTNAMELVSDLLQVPTSGEEMKKDPVDLMQMLSYCVELLRHKANEKQQQLTLTAAPVTLPLNREKMWRVVSNLIANAIKFSPAGSNIVVQLEEKQQQVLIAVKDQGIGIPAEMKDSLFDMFTAAKRTGTAGEQPFGLGLAISKQIVEAHGGSIRFDSKVGKGTTFFVELPM